MADPLTVGTAGHVDHGKTALVRALTGAYTDRLAEERRRGLSIELGFARLTLPSGRRLSLVDVPGHERFVSTMVAGATGIDLFLMVVAADDGPMPQTREHALVLRALGIATGVIAVTKSDRSDPAAATRVARKLIPGAQCIAVSAKTGAGLDRLRDALDVVAATALSRAAAALGPTRLHVDRVFSLPGAGTVLTGTLAAGQLAVGDRMCLLPVGAEARIRSLQVHGEARQSVAAGQRVAVALAGLQRADARRGDTLTGALSELAATRHLSVALDRFTEGDPPGRVIVHHGTRQSPARLRARGSHYELRLERPLVAWPGDRLVVRRMAPPETLGGGTILPAREPTAAARPALRAESSRAPDPALVAREATVRALLEAHGSISLAELRDALGTSRADALTVLNHCDSVRLTRRRPDDRRVLRIRRSGGSP